MYTQWHFGISGLFCFLVCLTSCGGGGSSSPPAPDFTLMLSGATLSIGQGYGSPTLTLTVSAKDGFTGSVNITMEGLPLGVSSLPPTPFALAPGTTKQLTFAADGEATAGSFTLTISGTSGSLSHSVQMTLDVTATSVSTKSYQVGTELFLENDVGNEATRVGLETQWGGTIVEASLNGTNFVNAHDTGREVQAAQYDGSASYDSCAGCTGVFGWDPVQGGDRYDHGSPVLAQALSGKSIYTKTQAHQWYPDDKGGGPTQPVLGDVYIEQTISAVPNHPHAFQVHYKTTHFGTDEHDNSTQEFPAVYVSLGFDRYVYYGGTSPWTNGSVTFAVVSMLGAGTTPNYYVPEHWAAFVNEQDVGLTVYVPGQYPYSVAWTFAGTSGPTGDGTNYFAPFTAFTFWPNSVLEGDIYVIVGDYKEARQAIYDLRNTLPSSDPFTPFGFTDIPAADDLLTGTVSVSGWTFDNVGISKVEILLDSVLIGQATYGLSRPDVPTVYPNADANVGFQYSLNTTQYLNGTHTLQVKVSDTNGNVAFFPRVPVSIRN